MADSHILGRKGEEIAAEYLKNKGYSIKMLNWRSGKKEIDIIAETENFIVFTEVKTRSSDYMLHPRDAVSVPKQRNLITAAQSYIVKNKVSKEVRFDIISIISDDHAYKIEHIEDAFYPTL